MVSGGHAPGPTPDAAAEQVVFTAPSLDDGAALWRIARDSGKLDLNSSYAYLLWCRDFTDTTVLARVDGEIAGFCLAFRRPAEWNTALVWQIAVDGAHRGKGLAGGLLDTLYAALTADGVRTMETTITPDNTASAALFTAFAERWGAELETRPLFAGTDFPDDHEPETLYRIGPLGTPPAGTPELIGRP